MISNKLLKFINEENKRLETYYTFNDKNKKILAYTVKLSEEVGELSEQILIHSSIQKKRKLQNYKKDDLDKEIADVVITTLLLGNILGVDINKALENKVEYINKRWEDNP